MSSTSAESGATSQQSRVEAELEFVQRLANPDYLHHLAQMRLLDDESFLAYLAYLEYWRRPEYARLIVFPHCLRFLELLKDAAFREALKRADFRDHVAEQQRAHWRYRIAELDRERQRLRQLLAAGAPAGRDTQ
jgi:mediator of RNA polymerase II transcription subunit 31